MKSSILRFFAPRRKTLLITIAVMLIILCSHIHNEKRKRQSSWNSSFRDVYIRSQKKNLTDNVKAPPQNVADKVNFEDVAKKLTKTKEEKPPPKEEENGIAPKPTNTNPTYPPHLHPDRFKFVHQKQRINLTGPIMNRIPGQVTWRHSLSQVKVCEGEEPFILAIVISALKREKNRAFIRNTWGNPIFYSRTKLRAIFVMGATLDAQLQKDIDAESLRHNDIIQYNYIDSYQNLTYKSLSWLTWVNHHCPDVLFVAKVDDDVLINPFHLRQFFEEQLENPPTNKPSVATEPQDPAATGFIYGRFDAEPYPLRDTKWRVSKEEYPEGKYPPFVHGPAYIVGRAALRLMVKFAPYVPFLKLEDVYTTGLLAHAAQIKHVQIFGQISTFKAQEKLYNGTQAILEETNDNVRPEAWANILRYAPL